MDTIDNRFACPKHDDFFIVQSKKVELKPEFKCIVEKQPNRRGDISEKGKLIHYYTESGTLLCLPEGPKYKYEQDEIDEHCVAHVKEGMVVSAVCNERNKTAGNVWPVFNETFFKDIPEIDSLVSRLENAYELGNVKKSEFDRVLPIIKNQRIAHEILNELCEKYGIKRDEKIKVHAKKCAYGGPRPSMEPFDYTIFCYVGQGFYKSGEPGPYMGQRIFWIEFPGWDYIHELVKEKCFPDKKSRQ